MPYSARRRPVLAGSIALLGAAAFLSAPASLHAQLQWDPGQTPAIPSGGTGDWNTTSPFWSDGAANTTWDNAMAIFGGAAGIVTIDNLGVGVSATGLTFNTSNYTIAAETLTDTLTLTGGAAISVGALATDTATISAIVAGSAGLAKSGAGTLVLSGANTYTGTTNITGGTISISAASGLGAATTAIGLNGGTLRTTADFSLNRGFSLTGTGNFVNVDAGTSLTMSAALVPAISGAGTMLTKRGAGTLIVTAVTDASFTNGNLVIEEGVLSFTSGAQLGAANTGLTLAGGTARVTATAGTTGRLLTLNAVAGNTFESTTGSSITFSNSATGAGGLTKIGPGSMTLSNASNNFAGGLTVEAGTITFSSTAPTAGFTGGLTINGGTAQFNHAGSLNNNAVALAGGTLRLQNDTAQTSTSAVTVTADSTLTTARSGGGAGVAHALGSLTLGTNTLNVTTANGTSGTQRLDITGTTTLTGNPTFNVVSSGGSTAELRLAGAISIGAGATLTKDGTGSLNLGTALTTDTVIINAGNIAMSSLGTTHTAGTTTLNGGSLSINSSNTWTTGSFSATGGSASSAGGNSTTHITRLTVGAGGLSLSGHSINLNTVSGGAGALGSIITLGGKLSSSGTSAIAVSTNAQPSTQNRALDLGGVNREIEVTGGTLTLGGANALAVINGSIRKTGAGLLSLVGVNSNAVNTALYDGLTIEEGVVTWTGDAGLGGTTNGVTINGGELRNATINQITVPATRVITIGAAGGALGNPTASNNGKILFSTAGTLAGAGTLTKSGANTVGASHSTLQISAAQAGFTGNVIVTGGFLELSANVLANAGSITVNSGEVSSNNGITPNPIVLNGGAMAVNGASGGYSNTVTVQSASFMRPGAFHTNSAFTMTLSGKVTGAGDVTVAIPLFTGYAANTGTVVLSSNTNDQSGTFTVQNNLTLTAQSATGTGSTLGTSAVTLAGGKLNLRDNSPGAYGNNVTVAANVGGGGTTGVPTIDVNNAGSGTDGVFNLGTFGIGAQTLNVTGGNGYRAAFNGLATFTGAPTFNITTADLALLGGISGTGFGFTKTGAGTLTIVGTSTADGPVAINGGTVIFNSAASVGGSGETITLNGGGAAAAGFAIDQAFIDRVSSGSIGSVALAVNSSNALDLTGLPGVRLGAGGVATFSGALTPDAVGYRLGGGTPGHVLTLPGTNALSGTRTLNVGTDGGNAGTVALTGSNNFTGAITISGGETLLAGSNASLGNAANSVTFDNGTLQLADAGDFTGFGARQLTMDAGGGTLHTGNNNITLATTLTGAGSFTKDGSGTLTLGGGSTLTGAIRVAGGTLATANLDALESATSVNLVGGTLGYTGTSATLYRPVILPTSGTIGGFALSNAGTTLTFHGIISGGQTAVNTLTLTGPGTFYPTRVNTFSSNILVNGGAVLQIAGPGGTSDATALGNVNGTPGRLVTLDDATFRVLNSVYNPGANTKKFVIDAGGGTFLTEPGTTLQLDDGAGTNNTAAGAAQLQGDGTLTKTGNGTLHLGGTAGGNYSSFTGEILVNAGMLISANSDGTTDRFALGTNTSGTTIASGATLDVRGLSSEPLTISGAGFNGGGALINSSGVAGIANGTVTLTGHTSVGGAGTLTVGGVVSGTGFNFTKIGAGTTTLTAANTYSGTTTITAGTLALGGANGSALSSTGVTFTGNSTLLLNNDDGAAGSTANNGDRIANGASINFASGSGTLELRGMNANGNSTETVGALNLNNAPGLVRVAKPAASVATGETVLSVASINRSGAGTLQLQTFGAGTLGGADKVLVTGTAPAITNGMVAPWIVNGTDARFVTYDGTNGFTNAAFTSTNAATSTLNDLLHLAAGGAVAGTALGHAVKVGDGTNTTALTGGAVQIGSGGLILHSSGAVTHSSQFIFNNGSDDVEALIFLPAQSITLSGAITATGLTRSGAGTLTLSSTGNATSLANAPVSIQGGTTIASVANALGSGGTTTVNGGILRYTNGTQNKTLELLNGTLEVRANSSTTFNTGALNVAGNFTLHAQDNGTNNASQTHTITGAVTAGNVVLTTTTGGTNAYALTLSGPVTMTGDLTINNANTVTLSNTLSEDASPRKLTKIGAGTLILSNAGNNFTGLQIDAGAVRIVPVGALSGNDVVLNGGRLELRNDASTNYATDINPLLASTLNFQRNGTTATNQTITLGNLGQGGLGALTLVGDHGYTLNVANIDLPGGLLYGNAAGITNPGASTVVVASGGSVSIGNGPGANARFGSKNIANTGGGINATFDATGAASFVAHVANFEVGVEPVTGSVGSAGTLRLPASAHVTALTRVAIGDSNNQSGSGTLEVGAGTTTFITPTFIVGGRKAPTALLTMAAGGTLEIHNGATRSTLIVGQNNAGTAAVTNANFDLSGAGAPRKLLANLSSLVVGDKTSGGSGSSAGGVNGTVKFGASPDTLVDIVAASGVAALIGRFNPNSFAATPTAPISGTVNLGAGTLNIATTDNAAPALRLGASEGTYAATHGGETRGIVNITGGNVTIANNGTGPAIEMTPTHAGATAANQLATAELNISGGITGVVGNINVGVATGAAVWSSTIALSGGTLDMNGGNIGNVTTLNFTGGTLRELGTLARALTQTGATSELLVTGAANTTINGAYALADGLAALSGGRNLNVADALAFNAGSTLSLEIGGALPGAGAGSYSQVHMTSAAAAVSLDATAEFTLSLAPGFIPAPSDVFYLLTRADAGTFSTLFAGTAEGGTISLGGGFTGQITYLANWSGSQGTSTFDGGNDVAVFNVIPEPGTAVSLLGGLTSLLGLQRFRRRQR